MPNGIRFKRSKYGAKKTEVDGHRFDSLAEAAYYEHLKLELAVGLITRIELQPKIYLTKAKILLKPDFKVWCGDNYWYVDVKGMRTPVFQIKARLWKHYGDRTLKVIKKTARGFLLEEEYTCDETSHNASPLP